MRQKEKGFTLIELMIVVVIVAILAAIAYPSYQDSVRKSRRTDAQGALMGFATAMERYYTNNNTYVGAVAGTVYSAKSPIDGATKYYDLSIEAATATTYTLRATPTGAQAGDGYLELLSTGLKRWQTGGSVNDCWAKSC